LWRVGGLSIAQIGPFALSSAGGSFVWRIGMDSSEQQLWDIAAADQSEWQRLVEENTALYAECYRLQHRYGLPLASHSELPQWIETQAAKICLDSGAQEVRYPHDLPLGKDLRDLMDRHGIPDKWHTPLWHLIVLGWPLGLQISMGFPGGVWKMVDGRLRNELHITADTPVNNPIISRFIRQWQQQQHQRILLTDDPPPKPQPMRDHPRKLDWRPLWEWHKRHPDITQAEIAKAIDRSHDTVRKKLAALNSMK
jgi:hypothetical protein